MAGFSPSPTYQEARHVPSFSCLDRHIHAWPCSGDPVRVRHDVAHQRWIAIRHQPVITGRTVPRPERRRPLGRWCTQRLAQPDRKPAPRACACASNLSSRHRGLASVACPRVTIVQKSTSILRHAVDHDIGVACNFRARAKRVPGALLAYKTGASGFTKSDPSQPYRRPPRCHARPSNHIGGRSEDFGDAAAQAAAGLFDFAELNAADREAPLGQSLSLLGIE